MLLAVRQALHRRQGLHVQRDHREGIQQDRDDNNANAEVEEQVKRGLERSETIASIREETGSRSFL